jgi:hypothetical protein
MGGFGGSMARSSVKRRRKKILDSQSMPRFIFIGQEGVKMRVANSVKKAAARPTLKTLDDAVMFLTANLAEMSKSRAESERRTAEFERQMKESNKLADRRMAEFERQMKETDRQMKETDRQMKETDRQIKESNERTDRQIKESNERTDRQIKESNERTDRQIKESNERTDRLIAESNARMEKLIAEMKETVDKLSENLGNMGNKLGELVELIVIPGMRRAVNAHGHNFTKSILNKSFYGIGRGGYKEKIAEVDMFLYNGSEAMAVEIKANLSAEDVTKHLERLKKLRKFEKDTNVQNKKLYGAIVGISVDFFARKLALKNGLYVLEIMEEEKRLQTEKPARCRVW